MLMWTRMSPGWDSGNGAVRSEEFEQPCAELGSQNSEWTLWRAPMGAQMIMARFGGYASGRRRD